MLRAMPWGCAVVLFAAGCVGGRTAPVKEPAKVVPPSRTSSAPGTRSGIVVLSCAGEFQWIDPGTGRTNATMNVQGDFLPSAAAGIGDNPCVREGRQDLRDVFSDDYSKAAQVVSLNMNGDQNIGYVTSGGQQKTVVKVRAERGFSDERPPEYKYAKFDPRTGDLWYAKVKDGLDTKETVYSQSLGGGRAVRRGSCVDCDGYTVAWKSGRVLPGDGTGTGDGPEQAPSWVSPDGSVAYVKVVAGFGETSGLRPWPRGRPYNSSHDPIASDISWNTDACEPVDQTMVTATTALCEGLGKKNGEGDSIGLLRINRSRRRTSVHDLLPATVRQNFDATASPDGQRFAFLSHPHKDEYAEDTRLYVGTITAKGKPSAPKMLANFPGGNVRILDWK